MKYTSIFALAVLAAVPVLAQNDISWVSQRTGLNSFTCGDIRSPCESFSWAANNRTNTGGVVKALDAGEYGQVNINKSIIIDGNGVGASIEASSLNGNNAVNVLAGNLEIRNLTIHVSPSCVCDGIVTGGHDVHVENVTINGSPRWGVVVANGSTATIHGLRVTNAGGGIYVSGGTATITDSLVRGSLYGIFADGTTGPAQLLIQDSKLISNGTGLLVENNGSGATARISGNVIAGNTIGISTSGGTLPGQIISFRDNAWAGNGADGTTPFSVSLK